MGGTRRKAPCSAPSPQLLFSADGNYLYTGARKDSAIICWDVRSTYAPVYTLQRKVGHRCRGAPSHALC